MGVSSSVGVPLVGADERVPRHGFMEARVWSRASPPSNSFPHRGREMPTPNGRVQYGAHETGEPRAQDLHNYILALSNINFVLLNDLL